MLWEATLGAGAVHRAALNVAGPVLIEGALYGDLTSDDLVEIAADGRVEGTICAPQVLCAGAVVGAIDASERCTLLASAVVIGALTTPWLDVRVGAQLDGPVRVRRGAPQEAS